jgi:mannitol/fructose-specific phosphotransferase system IIA component (Ntr-type)
MQLENHPVTAGTLADYTRPGLILPDLRERDTAGVIGELSLVLQRQGAVPDVLPFYHTALNQELLNDSAQSCGVAFPHARLSGIKQLQFAVGRSSAPISWGGKGSWPVRLVFLIAVPATDAVGYLHLLASLAALGQMPEHLESLRHAAGAADMLTVLEKVVLRHG